MCVCVCVCVCACAYTMVVKGDLLAQFFPLRVTLAAHLDPGQGGWSMSPHLAIWTVPQLPHTRKQVMNTVRDRCYEYRYPSGLREAACGSQGGGYYRARKNVLVTGPFTSPRSCRSLGGHSAPPFVREEIRKEED